MDRSNFDPKRLVATSYDRIAERYLEWRANQHRKDAAPWLSILREHLAPCSRVLDVGCGAGIPLTRILAETYDVTGVDISIRQIELARRNVPNARFINGDIAAFDFSRDSFDAAVGSYSFIHIPRIEHASLFRKIASWLRPGGLLLANFGIGNCEIDYEEDWLGVPMFWSSFDAEGERAALASAGFELLIDRIETELEDDRPHRWLVALAQTSSRPRVTNLDTAAGQLVVAPAGAADYDAVMAILREAADWLSARGNPQWKHWHMEAGERMLRDRLEHQEVYLARRDGVPVGTLTIQWSDLEQWGERGLDGSAGYIHGVAITRSVGGKRVGERLLEWAVDAIAARGRRFARLDAMASNAALCRYYEQRGFYPRGTATLFGGMYTAQLFEQNLRSGQAAEP